MTYSFYVPFENMPSGIEELKKVLNLGYWRNKKQLEISFNKSNPINSNLLNDLVIVEMDKEIQAWISFDVMQTEHNNKTYDYLAGVSTKNSINTAALVAYALCKHADSIVFNDCGLLNGKEIYTIDELSKLISNLRTLG